MGSITTAAPRTWAWTALLALLLAMRTITSAGYMPTVEHGRLALMLCPDGEWTAPSTRMAMPMNGQGGGSRAPGHKLCPYAAAAAMPYASADTVPLLPLAALGFVLLGAVVLPSFARRALLARPPSTGPPLPA